MDWSGCALVTRDRDVVHGEAVLTGTRIPAGTVIENIEAFLDEGLSLDDAVDATLECFPGVPGGANGIRAVLAYQAACEAQQVA